MKLNSINVAKCWAVTLIVGLIYGLIVTTLNFPVILTVIGGIVVGAVTMKLAMEIWDIFKE